MLGAGAPSRVEPTARPPPLPSTALPILDDPPGIALPKDPAGPTPQQQSASSLDDLRPDDDGYDDDDDADDD
eukprot:7438012-Karenia_brevis.AAC.1